MNAEKYQPVSSKQLVDWLAALDQSREWAANQLGVSRRTIDGWTSGKNIPLVAQRLIRRLMNDYEFDDLRLTFQDWELVYSAMQAAGYDNFKEFVSDTLCEYLREQRRKSPDYLGSGDQP